MFFFFKPAKPFSGSAVGCTTCSNCSNLSFLSGGRRSSWVRSWTVWTYFRDYFPIRVSETASFLGQNRCHASKYLSNCWTAMQGQPCRDSHCVAAVIHSSLSYLSARHHNHKFVSTFEVFKVVFCRGFRRNARTSKRHDVPRPDDKAACEQLQNLTADSSTGDIQASSNG